MKYKYLLILISVATLISCNPSYYQIYELSSPSLSSQHTSWNYSDSCLTVNYNFWEEDGIMSFTILNKIDYPIYIDWKKSSFILNAIKLDYWIEESSITSIYKMYEPNTSAKDKYEISSSVVLKNERVSFIPPNSIITKYSYKILPEFYYKLGIDSHKLVDTIINNFHYYFYFEDFNNKEKFFFRNYLTYSNNENFITETHIDNDFYIKRIYEVNEEYFNATFLDHITKGKQSKYFFKEIPNNQSLEWRIRHK